MRGLLIGPLAWSLVAAGVLCGCATRGPVVPPATQPSPEAPPPQAEPVPPPAAPAVALADDGERVWFSRMIGHALDMGQLTNAVLALSYPQVRERARALAREAASPELGERAQALAEAAAHEDPEEMARAYGKLTEACVTCHVARRGAR